MTLHRYYPAALLLLTIAFSAGVAHAAAPGEEFYKSLLYIWEQAPSKYSGIMPEDDWGKVSKGNAYAKGLYETYELPYDIPEFEEEQARMVRLKKEDPEEYVISAKKKFSSDAACEAYYQDLLTKIPVLLAKDNIKISRKKTHVFYKDKNDRFYRRVYVKRYLSADRGDQPRIIVSVRVEFTEK